MKCGNRSNYQRSSQGNLYICWCKNPGPHNLLINEINKYESDDTCSPWLIDQMLIYAVLSRGN